MQAPMWSCSWICHQPSWLILWLPVSNSGHHLWGVCDWSGIRPRAYFLLSLTQRWNNQSLGYVVCLASNISLGQRANAKSEFSRTIVSFQHTAPIQVHWLLGSEVFWRKPCPRVPPTQSTPKPETKSNGLLSHMAMVGCLLKKKEASRTEAGHGRETTLGGKG